VAEPGEQQPDEQHAGGAAPAPPPARLRDLPREVLILSAVAFCVALGFGIVGPAIPLFARSFEVSNLEASAVVSVFALVRLLTAPLSGALVNRMGERTVLATGLLIVAVSSAAAGFSQNYGELLVLRGLGGFGSSMFSVSSMALLLRVVDVDLRGRAAGTFQGGFLVGSVTGPFVGGIVIAWSLRAPFFVYAVTLLLATVVTLVFLARTHLREREAKVSHGEANRLEALRVALRDRAYQAALGESFVAGFVVFGMRSAAVPLFVTEGLDRAPSLTAWAFLAGAIVQLALLLPAGTVADHKGRRPAMLAGTVLLTVGMVVLTVADLATNSLGTASAVGTLLLLVAMVIQGASGAFLGSAPAAVVGDIMGGRRGGIVVATFQMMSDVGSVAGPLVAGLLIDVADFDWAFGLGVIISLLSIILVIRMPETLRKRAQSTR
jgi:MFS family permease